MAGERAKKEYVWTPIFVTSAHHHGLAGSYPSRLVGKELAFERKTMLDIDQLA
jgi:hypothetical protein